MNLTLEEKVFLVTAYAKVENGLEVTRQFRKKFGRDISHNTPKNIFDKFTMFHVCTLNLIVLMICYLKMKIFAHIFLQE